MDFQTRSKQAAAGKWNPWAEGVRQMLHSLCFCIGDIREAWNGCVLDMPWRRPAHILVEKRNLV